MASNGLVANPTKTTFLIINNKTKSMNTIRIGDNQEKSAKLLGMQLTDDLQWKEHIGKTINALRKRLFLITRLRNKLNGLSLKRISESLFNSKIRYGLLLCGKVRQLDQDPKQGLLHEIQLIQNKLFRTLNNSTLKDKIRTKNIVQDLNMLSTNQINAQAKLTEIWKILNVQKQNREGPMLSRAASRGDLLVKGKTELRQSTFINDASKIWNNAPLTIKQSKTISSAKIEIKKFVKTLPI